MSGELVPLSYDRCAWNKLHNLSLREHGSLLSAKQAAQINGNFSIELYVGNHGRGLTTLPNDLDQLIGVPTQREYDQAAQVVEGLEPNDVLFIEGHGFTRQPEMPNKMSETDHPWDLLLAHYSNHVAREELERARMKGEISAWDYASSLAELKGVAVVVADHDAFEEQRTMELAGGKYVTELGRSTDSKELELATAIHTRREYKACNTIKDWALAHLPKHQPLPESRKPKLALLFGIHHREGLAAAFQDMGLHAHVEVLATSSLQERTFDHMTRIIGEMATLFTPYVLDAFSAKPGQNPQ